MKHLQRKKIVAVATDGFDDEDDDDDDSDFDGDY